MDTNLSEMRNVAADELRTIEGGFGFLVSLVIIMTADQQRAAVQPTQLVHEPKHQ
ncbi:MAG: hypothetical protein JNG89_20190 [Planctomycetaceae bacterium]|nr:hypothetical protein [Planctomycetaceae bacterium]